MFLINLYNTNKKVAKKLGDFDKKIPDASGLVTTTVLNTETAEQNVENKIPDTSDLVATTFCYCSWDKNTRCLWFSEENML